MCYFKNYETLLQIVLSSKSRWMKHHLWVSSTVIIKLTAKSNSQWDFANFANGVDFTEYPVWSPL